MNEPRALRLMLCAIEHAPVVATLLSECFDDPWSTKEVVEIMAMPGGFGILADEGDGPVGYILIQAAADEASVLSIGVIAACRRRGIAGRLLAAGECRSAEAGAAAIFLEVAADDSGACAFYRKAGYVEVGRRANYYQRQIGGRVDALLLRRTLSEDCFNTGMF
jgi:ribosomal protein S18 acetylase RimI-like enzyme